MRYRVLVGRRAHELHGKHMIGVCYKMLRQYREALNWFAAAKSLARLQNDDRALGNILRDEGDTMSLLGRHQEALSALSESARLLKETDEAGWAITTGFKGRVLARMGCIDEALLAFDAADFELSRSDNRHLELYNLVPYIGVMVRSGQYAEDHLKERCDHAQELACEHGSIHHKVRIKLLRLGAYRTDHRLDQAYGSVLWIKALF